MNELKEKINSIEHVECVLNDTILQIKNQNTFKATINSTKIISTNELISPLGEHCLRVNFDTENFIIITPNDFVFNTLTPNLVIIEGLPPLVSINEMLAQIEEFVETPEPSKNIDYNIARYMLCKQLILSAKEKGFEVEFLLKRIKEIAQNTEIGNVDDYF